MAHKKLFLLDGMALAYRAHFAFISSNLRNSEGLATGPMFGFANTLVQILDTEQPTHIAVAWDTHAPTFRHDMDDQYKANRPPQPDELRQGIPYIKKMLEGFKIANLELDGFEADDIIGTLATVASTHDVDVFMVTPDKDFMQLVTERIKLYKPLNNAKGFDIVGIDGVVEYFGVTPDKVIDVLALIGDASDNVPGMPGVGKKGAPALINEFGSIENLIANADSIKANKTRENIKANTELALKSKEMVTIYTSVPGFDDWEKYQWNGADNDSLYLFFKEMGFRSLTNRYQPKTTLADSNQVVAKKEGQSDLFAVEVPETETEQTGDLFSSAPMYKRFESDKVNYVLVQEMNAVQELADRVNASASFCFDTETTGTDPMLAEPVGLSFAFKTGEAFYIDLVHSDLDKTAVFDSFKASFADSSKELIAQNAKYDIIIMERQGIPIKNKIFDTMIAAYLIDPNQKVGMDELSMKFLNYEPISIKDLIGSGKSQKSMADVDAKTVSDYACEDADITLQLADVFRKQLDELDLGKVSYDIEFPLIHVLAKMEMNGVKIDLDLLKSISKQLTEDIIELESQIYSLAGEQFNINSTQQLGAILFDKLKLPTGKKTATGKYSTSEDVLSTLAVKYEIAAHLLDYRTLSKLKSTYVDALPKLIHPETGRVHTAFNQHVAATGRLSSSNPNLQNIPIRTSRGKEIRKAFVPESGKVLISADYSQIELRVIADIANDEAMREAFRQNEDIHARTAKEIFHLDSLDEVTSDHRRKAKEVNFGIPYGVSAYGLASRLGIENSEGKAMIQAYFDRFPGVKAFMADMVVYAKEHGYVKTITGRRRPIPDIHASNFNIRSFAERTSINTPIQGSAADLIKMAMIAFEKAKDEHQLKTEMILQVHDELVFEAPKDEVEKASQLIQQVMESAMEISVPLKVEVGTGDNWLDAH
ncbi:DNA polymerase I [bacterium]|nr:MAG: DNA polymerase I [bacterium]